MSLIIDTNRLAQQRALPPQLAQAKTARPSAAAQGAASTDNFMSGLQDLLARLKAVG